MAADRRALLSPPLQRALRPRFRALIRNAGFADFSANFDGRPADAGPTQGDEPFWALEGNPLIIEAEEWTRLEAGLRQRARFANALLTDLYDGQRVLREGLLPPEVILADPYYRRPCLRLDTEAVAPATLLRFDLVRGPAGWYVAQTRANTPIGMSFAVQNRRFMTQEAGEVYRRLPDYHSIINFPLQLLDALRRLAPRGRKRGASAPSIVMLTAGPQDPFYSEHSFLARKMGLPLAKGDDLLVLDNHVYFKTIAGLEQVDVIYRRLNDAHIDPVVFDTDRETAGIPGLIQCIRAGNVTVSNAIGSGIAESRAIDAFLPRLMRFYLAEKPILPPLPTYTCGDTDQMDYILENAASLRIRPAHDPRLGEPRFSAPAVQIAPGGGIPAEISENCFAFVAQPTLPLAAGPGEKRGQSIQFSAYVLARGRDISVLPGGLVHIDGDLPPADRIGTTADVIVLRGDSPTDSGVPSESAGHDEPAPAVLHHALGSRTAESLFWLGRYIERAETTARMLSIIDDVALEEIPARERRRWLPVWQGLLEATGHSSRRITARERPEAALAGDLSWRMTLDPAHASSIYSSVVSAVFNARKLRDFVSPEAWSVLRHLHGTLDSLRRQGERARIPRAKAHTTAAVNAVVVDVNAFLSTAERTMLHDAGWQFLRMGIHLERSVMSCSALRHVLVSAVTAGPGRTENPELSALLRMLGSQDAYRRLYQTRSQPRQAADFILRQPDAPRSVLHNLEAICDAHEELEAVDADTVQAGISAVIARLRAVDIAAHFAGGAADAANLDAFLTSLIDDIEGLHRLVSDHYFSHQARLAIPIPAAPAAN